MKFPFYTNLNDNSSASSCRDISKQRARALSAPKSYKVSKKPSRDRVKEPITQLSESNIKQLETTGSSNFFRY